MLFPFSESQSDIENETIFTNQQHQQQQQNYNNNENKKLIKSKIRIKIGKINVMDNNSELNGITQTTDNYCGRSYVNSGNCGSGSVNVISVSSNAKTIRNQLATAVDQHHQQQQLCEQQQQQQQQAQMQQQQQHQISNNPHGRNRSSGTSVGHQNHHHRHRRAVVNIGKTSNESMAGASLPSSGASTASSCNTDTTGSTCSDDCDSSGTSSSGEPNLPYPGFPAVSLKYLTQDTKPRNWCLRLITNPWFERVSILVILLNCITLGMYQPCVDDACVTNRCKILQIFDDIIFAFFSLEMTIKMIAMGIYGKNTYLADSWNRLDFFIVLAGALEYCLHVENLNLTAIRTIRVLRPLRAINRIPSMRILVMLLLDTLPMLGNVLLLCFFVFFIFGIVGVQLWEGILRQRCVLQLPPHVSAPKGLHDEYRVRVRVNSVSFYYEISKEQDYICSKPEDSGMHLCSQLPQYRYGPNLCNASAVPFTPNNPNNVSCVNWNQYYTNCTQLGSNPFQGTISFDNIGLAWVAIFLVISLEGWTDIMYYVQDAHSFWDWIYFVLLIVIGSFFMINLCLVVIATQFAETKKREMDRMRQERKRFTSTSTLASSNNNSEPTTCYAEIVKYIGHLWRRLKRRLIKKLRLYKYQRQQRKEGLLPNMPETLTLSPSRIRCHHPKCPKMNRKSSNINEQLITVMVPLNSSSANNLNTSMHNITVAAGSSNIINNNNNNNNLNNNNHNNNDSQISSPDNSELSFEHNKNNALIMKNVNTMLDGGSGGGGGNCSYNNKDEKQKTILLKIPSITESELLLHNPSGSGFLSPPTSARRRSSVMFNEFVILHTPPTIPEPVADKNSCSSEKMTQAGDGSIWQVNLPQTIGGSALPNTFVDCSELSLNDAMTCQELLAFSVAFSAALPTGHTTLDSFYSSLTRNNGNNGLAGESNLIATTTPSAAILNTSGGGGGGVGNSVNLIVGNTPPHTATTTTTTTPSTAVLQSINQQTNANYIEDFSCCYDLHQNTMSTAIDIKKKKSKWYSVIVTVYKVIMKIFSFMRRYVKRLVEHKYFQQGILLAILINTLSMGIEYHNQPEELTAIVETSNIVFSGIFAVEMLLKIIAEGPFKYIANGFNVFDGVIVILSVIELCQAFLGIGEGNSGLSVLRTFRLLRILKLVRFMPNLRRQLFVMLRTMDNVAVFFSLLILFIFIFSILGMYLFGGKFCKFMDDNIGQERECTCPEIVMKHPQCECDRKHFNNFLWATVTVFQILTQEDWNVVLFNGMEKTSHWAALYFVALMTFGNYVLFNLLVAILVEGFSSERNERREREQRELVKAKLREENITDNMNDLIYEDGRRCSESTTTSDSYNNEIKNKWHSAEQLQKDPKCNIQKQRLLQPGNEYGADFQELQICMGKLNSDKDTGYSTDGINKKLNPGKERRCDPLKIENIYVSREPPTITTTAATPQDSPSTTLEQGVSFRNWEHLDLESIDKTSCQSIPSLLKPPTIMSSFKTLDDSTMFESSLSIPQFTKSRSPNQIVMSKTACGQLLNGKQLIGANRQLLITTTNTNNNNINNNNNGYGGSNKDLDDIPKITSDLQETNLFQQQQLLQQQQTQQQQPPERGSSFKKIQRGSSKRKKGKQKSDCETGETVLNNGRDHLPGNGNSPLKRNDPVLPATNRIQNDTKDTTMTTTVSSLSIPTLTGLATMSSSVPTTDTANNNRLSPHNSIKRKSSIRRNSCINNSQFYQNLNRSNSIKNHPVTNNNNNNNRRRMSSVEYINTYEKASNLNIYSNLENQQQHQEQQQQQQIITLDSSKLDLTKTAKSYSNINITSGYSTDEHVSKIKQLIQRLKPTKFTEDREDYALYIFPEDNKFRRCCSWFVNQKWFDNVILLFIALNCITLAMERPNIPPSSTERVFLGTANYIFTVVFTIEMFIKVVAAGMFYGADAYFTSGWNIMDGSLVTISIIDLLMSLISESSPRIFGILRVFRLLRSLRPLRVINRAPGLKLVVQTLLSSLRPIGNIVLICCTFFIIFGILGVQLFKGTFFYCEGENIKGVRNRSDCISIQGNVWINRKYNFDDLGKALMSLFVLSSRDGWVNIMYTGLDAVGVDQQPIVNYNEWRLLYFIAFILLVGFFVLNMFVGVVVENFHRCREEQEKEEKIRRAAKRALQMEKKRRRMHEPPYYTNYSPLRMFVHNVVTSKYFDLAIAAVIGLNVVTMAMEYYMMPVALEYALKIFNYFFTAVFILEAIMKLVALGVKIYMKDKWNQLDVGIVILSIVGIVLEELETNIIPINPTIIRVMRVLRIARVLKLLKMAKGIRALLDTVMQALPQVGNLGLLFFLLFFIFAALGVELFGRLECSDEIPCQGLGEHAHFANFGMAFLTLFRVATGDNWNGIMKDTLRDDCDDAADCVRNCCVSTVIAPIFFVIFVLMAQFVLVNVVVAVLMKHLEESHKQMEDEMDIDTQLERELEREQEFQEDQALCFQLEEDQNNLQKRPLAKVSSLPSNFTYSTPVFEKKYNYSQRRQTVQYLSQTLGLTEVKSYIRPAMFDDKNSIAEGVENVFLNDSDNDTESIITQTPILLQQQQQQQQQQQLQQLPQPKSKINNNIKYIKNKSWKAGRQKSFDDAKLHKSSNDNLLWRNDTNKIFLNNNFNKDIEKFDINNFNSNNNSNINSNILSNNDNNIIINNKITDNLDTIINNDKNDDEIIKNPRQLQFASNRLCSIDSALGIGPGGKSFLSVPKLQTRNRTGSTRQLFKQQALDEDPDIDESTLLLPNVSKQPIIIQAQTVATPQLADLTSPAAVTTNMSPCTSPSTIQSTSLSLNLPEITSVLTIPATSAIIASLNTNNSPIPTPSPSTSTSTTAVNTPTIGKIDNNLNIKKSDSSEILRIISERRKIEKRDIDNDENSDCSELLLHTSQQSSAET